MLLRDTMLPEFDHETANTRKVLERVPDDKLDFKPHPRSWDMATLATHLANIPSWMRQTISKDSIDIASPEMASYQPPRITSRKELLELFDKNLADAREALAVAENDQLMSPWSLLQAGQPVFTLPKVAVLRSWVFNHSVHHRAQLCLYLRMNEIPVPAVYGPSADEQPF